ncbi:7899_t:CDS:2, partial [Paraglomus occultum]
DEYINIDSTLQIEDRLSDDDIIALVNGEQVEEECSNSQVEQKIVAADAVKSIDILTAFLKQREMDIGLSENFIYELNQCTEVVG